MIDRLNEPWTITIQLQVKTVGWAGIGFRPEQFNTMKGADIALCRIPTDSITGEVICHDMKALDVGVPKLDVEDLGTTYDLYDISGSREDDILNVMFTRKLDATDRYDNSIGDDTRIIFAYNPITNDLRYHGPSRSSATTINFLKDYKGPPIRKEFSVGVKIFLYVLAAIGIVSALVFLIMIAVSTEHFRFQTPEFCAIICVGAIIGYISIILILPDSQTDKTCWASIWLFGMSFWIVFAGMFVKIGRVYWIVRALTKDFEQLTIPLWQLLIPMGICMLGEMVFQICWDTLIPPNLEQQIVKDDNIYYEYCAGNRFMWLGSTVVKAIFLGVGVYLALQTREFQKEINWSKELVLSIYTLAVVLTILIPLGYAISDSAIMVVLLKGLGIFVAYFTVTFIMFFDSVKRIVTGQEARTVVASNSVTRSSAASRTQSGV
jgi:preprotein translocase subunit Sss1